MRIRWAAGAIASILLVTGCARSNAAPPTATLTQGKATNAGTTASTSTSTTIDVTRAPAAADVAYAQAVMNRLDHALGDGLRLFAQAKGPTQEFYDYLRAVYGDPLYDRMIAAYGRIAAQTPENLRTNPGDPVTRVRRVIGATDRCMFFTVDRTFAPLFVKPAHVASNDFIQLLRKRPERSSQGKNPTEWAVVADGSNPDGSVPENPCK